MNEDLRNDLLNSAIKYTDGIDHAMQDRYGRLVSNYQTDMQDKFEKLLEEGVPEDDAINVAETDFCFSQKAEEDHLLRDQANLARFLTITTARIDKFCDN